MENYKIRVHVVSFKDVQDILELLDGQFASDIKKISQFVYDGRICVDLLHSTKEILIYDIDKKEEEE